MLRQVRLHQRVRHVRLGLTPDADDALGFDLGLGFAGKPLLLAGSFLPGFLLRVAAGLSAAILPTGKVALSVDVIPEGERIVPRERRDDVAVAHSRIGEDARGQVVGAVAGCAEADASADYSAAGQAGGGVLKVQHARGLPCGTCSVVQASASHNDRPMASHKVLSLSVMQ